MFEMLLLAAALVISDQADHGKLREDTKIALEKEIVSLSGYYDCTGMEPNGEEYEGVAIIVRKRDVYIVTWVTGGASTFSGVGIRHGDNFAVNWTIQTGEKLLRGVNLYKIRPGPVLDGVWTTLPGDGLMKKEKLIFEKRFRAIK